MIVKLCRILDFTCKEDLLCNAGTGAILFIYHSVKEETTCLLIKQYSYRKYPCNFIDSFLLTKIITSNSLIIPKPLPLLPSMVNTCQMLSPLTCNNIFQIKIGTCSVVANLSYIWDSSNTSCSTSEMYMPLLMICVLLVHHSNLWVVVLLYHRIIHSPLAMTEPAPHINIHKTLYMDCIA